MPAARSPATLVLLADATGGERRARSRLAKQTRRPAMDPQLAFAFPQQVFGRNVADTFSDKDDEKFQQRIRAKLDANVYDQSEVRRIVPRT